MSNKTILQSNNNILNANNLELQNLIELANNLPEASTAGTYTLTVPSSGDGSVKIILSNGTETKINIYDDFKTFLVSAGEKIIIEYPMSPAYTSIQQFSAVTYLQGESGTKYENSQSDGRKEIIIMPSENCIINYRDDISDLQTTYTITINTQSQDLKWYYYNILQKKWISTSSKTFSIIPGSIVAIHQEFPDAYRDDGISVPDDFIFTNTKLLYSFYAEDNFLRCIYLPTNNAIFEY